MTCLDDDTVLGLVEGRIAPPLLVDLDVHLDSCATCRAVIAQVSRANVVERGRTIGRYVIGDLLGTGTMGRVYAAWEPELDRNVALKLLRDDSAPARARLLREAQSMAKLAHPNVVTVHEVGMNGDDVFVAMELVDGDNLRAWAGARSWRDKNAMLVEVARGLAAVHAAGVIHRDVKPDNIIVGRDGRARLGDFGLARSETTAREPAHNTLAVGSTAIAGTPAYMAPEVLQGDAADAASDQFSFGVTAYEILSGTRPFPGRTWAEIAMACATTSPAPLAGPRWLDATIRRCLAVDPARRFPTMAAVALELSSRPTPRRPVAWIAAAAIVASAATWFVVGRASNHGVGAAELATTWSPAIRERLASRWKASPDAPAALAELDTWSSTWIAERDAAVETPMSARDVCLEHRRTDFSALVANLDATVISQGSVDRVVDALGALGSPIECRTASSGADPVPIDQADRIRTLGNDIAAVRAAVALGDARRVVDRTRSLVDAAFVAGHAPTLAEALLVRAEALRAVDRFADASLAARDAIAAAERGHDDTTAARAWLARVALASDVRALDQADDLAVVAAAAIDRAAAPDRLVASLARIRGTIAFDRGDLARATELVTHARGLFFTDEHAIDIAATDSILGSIARTAGDLEAAESWHREALDIDRELRGPAHPDVARDLHNLAGVLRLRGDLVAAEASYRQALAIEVATARATEAGLTHNSLGLVAMARRDWVTARSELEAARDALGGHGDLALAEHNLGLVAAATGDHAAAIAHYKRAAEIYHATIGDDAASPIRLGLDRARSELAIGHRDLARELAIHARDAARRANITWIADDATALVTDLRVVVARPVVAVEPSRPPPPPVVTPPTPPTPQPKRDVGAYGSSHP